ncbi:MAG: EAL domain-containing protein [Gammaproteobacteria bacterium]
MSLTRQLWLAIAVMMALAFGGTFLISTAAARHYLEQQLFVKNVDNATALALMLSQIDKDPVTIELLLSAQFDVGHYRLIRLTDPLGGIIVERRNDTAIEGVPQAFVATVPLRVAPGVAQVQDGWKQYGTLTVQSHDRYAYAELWKGTLELLGWFLLIALGTGVLGSALLRLILRPLQAVVGQAEAIGARRFVTTAEPSTLEFRRVVRAMNTLSERVHQMVDEEAARVEQLRRQAQIDPVSGLLNRETFAASLEGALGREDAGSSGVLVILRVAGLADLNRSLGREAVDQILRRIGEQLSTVAAGHGMPWVLARLNGSDFAVLAPAETDVAAVGGQLAAKARLALDRPDTGESPLLSAGGTRYRRGELRAKVIARADGALAQAEQSGKAVVVAAEDASAAALPGDLASWRTTLERSLTEHGVKLGRYPVLSVTGSLMHDEAPVRVRIGGEWLPASRFIAWAARLGMLPRLDMLVVETALRRIEADHTAVSVNLSPEALCDPGFVSALASKLRAAPETAEMLWLEVPEYGALQHLDAFRRLCVELKPLGCKLGLKHAGQQFARIAELNELGLDYLKIDASIVHGVGESSAHQVFLRGMCTVAHAVGLLAIAGGVGDEQEIRLLTQLGVDGVTWPGVRVA